MRVLVALLLLAMTGCSSATYCLCRDGVGDLQATLDYACGHGADCTAIKQNGACVQPNTVKSHCDWAVNSYFQSKGQASGSCDFSGTATLSANPPSNVASGCVYPSSPSNTGTPTTGTTPPSGTTLTPPTGTTPTPPGGTNPSVFPGTNVLGPSGSNGIPSDVARGTNSCALTLGFSGLVFLWVVKSNL